MSDPRALRTLNRIESSVFEHQGPSELYQESKAEGGLTIFIPSWNHRPYLPRSIRSALNALECLEEAGFLAEVFVVDGASRDGSQKLLRSIQMLYDEPRLRTLFLKQNIGLPGLRNLALRMSRFRYVCLMDGDNELVPDNLPLFLQSIIDTGAALVYGNLLDKQGEDIVGARSNEMATMRLLEYNYIDAFSIVDAEKLLRLGGYTYDSLIYGLEDWEMVLHLIAEEEEIAFVPSVMGYFYANPLSMTQEIKSYVEESNAMLRRMFAQTGTREWDSIPVGRIYHPAVGFIDEW